MLIKIYRWLMEEPKPCESCELLRSLLDTERFEKKQLLDKLINKDIPNQIKEVENFELVTPKHVPWRVRQQMLEAEDREKAKILRRKAEEDKLKPSVEELEKELGVNNG